MTLLAALLCAGTLWGQSNTVFVVLVPWQINPTNLFDYTRTNTPVWWKGGINFSNWPSAYATNSGVPEWAVSQAFDYNFSALSNWIAWYAMPGITGLQGTVNFINTNPAEPNLVHQLSWIPVIVSNYIAYSSPLVFPTVLTNGFAGAALTSVGGGIYEVQQSADLTNWYATPTNVAVHVRLLETITSPGGGAGGASNLVIYSFSAPQYYQKTNQIRDQFLFADNPIYPQQVETKYAAERFASGNSASVIKTWSGQPAQSAVVLGGNTVVMSGTWERQRGTDTNVDSIVDLWMGQPVWTESGPANVWTEIGAGFIPYDWPTPVLSAPPYTVGPNYGTNLLFVFPTNLPSAPFLLVSRRVDQAQWTLVTNALCSWPTNMTFIETITNWDGSGVFLPANITGYTFVTNTGVMMSVAMPFGDQGFFKAALSNAAPTVGKISSLLQLTPIPTIRSNSTTWGMVNLIATDGTNLLHAYGTNQWERIVTQRTW